MCYGQALSYLYAKYAAVYTLSKEMLHSAIKTWIMTLVYLQQVKSNQTNLIDHISDDYCDSSISWHYSVNVAEQHRKLLEVDSFKRWPKIIAIQNMRGQRYYRAAKYDNGSIFFSNIETIFRYYFIIVLINVLVWYIVLLLV